MAIQWLTGLEHGAASTNGGGLWNFANNASVVTTDKNTGSYSLYLNSTGATARIQKSITSTNVVAAQFYIKFPANLPSAACQIFTFETGGTWAELFIDPADGKLYTSWAGSGNKHATALTTGKWYRIDVLINTSAQPNTFDYRIDGVAATQVSFNNPSQTGTVLTIGNSTAVNFQAYYDDIGYGNASGDYPLQIVGIELLAPESDDTDNSNYGTNGIEINDGTDVDGTNVPGYDRLNSVPLTQTSRYLRQNGTGASENARVNFANTSRASIKGVMAVLSYFAAGTNANNGSTRVYRDSSNYTTVYSGDMSETSLFYKTAMVTLASNDAAGVNALQGDIGRSSDGSPVPYWAGLALEVAYGPEANASASLTLAAMGHGVTATVDVQAQGSPTLAGVGLDGAGAVELQAAGSMTLAAMSGTASATVESSGVQATANISLAGLGLAGVGAVELQAAGSMTLAAMTGEGVGEVGAQATANISLAGVGLDGAGAVELQAAGSMTLAALSGLGVGELGARATANISLAGLGLDGAGAVELQAAGLMTLAAMTGEGVGEVGSGPAYAESQITLAGITVGAAGTVETRASANLTLSALSADGSHTTIVIVLMGNIILAVLTSTGQILVGHKEIAQALGQVIDLFGASLALEGVNSAVVEIINLTATGQVVATAAVEVEISEIGSVEIGGL